MIVDVIIVTLHNGAEGVEKGRGGLESKGWAVATRQGTKVDGDSLP